jgi:hypothetical protein
MYLIAFCLLALGLVLLVKTFESVQRLWQPSLITLSAGAKTMKTLQNAAAINK